MYCTELAKVTESPVFHVNADDPEAVMHVISAAVKLRQEFHCDVYVDILGYRKYGHNEGDEPRFTQPIMYQSVAKHKNVYEQFLNVLVSDQTIKREDADQLTQSFKQDLQEKLEFAKNNPIGKTRCFNLKGYRLAKPNDFESSIKTATNTLDQIATALTQIRYH